MRGPAAWLIIDDPERRNPLSLGRDGGLAAALGTAAADPTCGWSSSPAQGIGPSRPVGTCPGGSSTSPSAASRRAGRLADVFRSMRRLEADIARVNGHALAGGFGLAAACDIVVAVEHARSGPPRSRSGCGR